MDIDPETVAFLRSHREREFGLGLARDDCFVFTTLTGQPIHYRNLEKDLSKAAERAGLREKGKKSLRFHDLRHRSATS